MTSSELWHVVTEVDRHDTSRERILRARGPLEINKPYRIDLLLSIVRFQIIGPRELRLLQITMGQAAIYIAGSSLDDQILNFQDISHALNRTVTSDRGYSAIMVESKFFVDRVTTLSSEPVPGQIWNPKWQ